MHRVYGLEPSGVHVDICPHKSRHRHERHQAVGSYKTPIQFEVSQRLDPGNVSLRFGLGMADGRTRNNVRFATATNLNT